MRKRQKQLHRVDDIHKPKPFLRFRLRVVVAFFIICMLACLVYYMILANADPSHIITEHCRQFCKSLFLRAIPHKDCATDASSNFSSDETKSGVNT